MVDLCHCAAPAERHDHVGDVLASLFREAGIAVVKEANFSFVSPHSSTHSLLRPADLPLPWWTQGKSTCVDVSGVFPFLRTYACGWLGPSAISMAVTKKLTKDQLICVQNGHAFLPFAFDTFGGFSPEAIYFLGRLHCSLAGFMYTRDVFIVWFV